jgi:flagellar hook protein FlgE
VTDKNGYIVNASGDYLQGYPVDDSGTLQTGTVTDIQIKTGNSGAGHGQHDLYGQL